ncbi:MAG: DinB family protein [Acidobacteriota bacterium]|nr:DinB family protein [Acidobacteriota bacterium]
MKTTLLMIIAVSVPVLAQTSVPDAIAKHWKTSGEFTMAVAKAMPAESYDFRPSPEEMTFGQLMAHIAGANLGACANASGLAAPALPPKIAEYRKNTKLDVDHDTAISFLSDSFDFCNKAVAATTPEHMHTVVGPPARNMTGFEWLWAYFTHTAHHRGQAEVYLRMKGIKPPDYKF